MSENPTVGIDSSERKCVSVRSVKSKVSGGKYSVQSSEVSLRGGTRLVGFKDGDHVGKYASSCHPCDVSINVVINVELWLSR